MLENLKKYNIILASNSPRRKELLAQLDVKFSTFVLSGIDETYPADINPEEVPEFLARKKGAAYRDFLKEKDIVITADTIVICDGEILGKPLTEDEAVRMLMKLSGKDHKVITGVNLLSRHFEESFSCTTIVRFGKLSSEEAQWYVSNYKPLDKAGAYGIQEWIGCVAVESISGSFYNVMGLPVNRLYNVLKRLRG